MNEEQPRGLFAGLSPGRRKFLREYEGPENHGDEEFALGRTKVPVTNLGAGRRPIRAGDRLLCDGWPFGAATLYGHPCVATQSERTVCGTLCAVAKDELGVSHMLSVGHFRHAE